MRSRCGGGVERNLAISRVPVGYPLEMGRPSWGQPETASQLPPNQEADSPTTGDKSAFRI